MAASDKTIGIAACAAALILLAIAAMSGAAYAAAASAPTISSAWLRLPVVSGRPAATYAKITGGKVADRLIAVEGPKPARFELHETRSENGVMRMVALPGIAVAAGQTVEMKPGGMHVMVYSLPDTKPDSRVPLVFVFEKAGRIAVSAHTTSAGGSPARDHDQHAH